jgi:hypothetical protein
MTQYSTAPNRQKGAQGAAGEAAEHPWVKNLARVGLVAIGTVYILVGGLALRLAMGSGGGSGAPDQGTALQQIQEAPLGRFMLGLIALGLFGYLIWRLTEAFADSGGEGSDAKGLGKRAGHAINGLVYGGLGIQAALMAMGNGGGGGSGQQEWTGRLMSLPFGRWLVGLAGLYVIGYGVYQIYEAWKEKYRDRLIYSQMSAAERRWIDPLSKAGLVAHGVVLGLAGLFLIQAAYRFNPEEAQGLSGALNEIARQPFGPWLLGLVAIGLACYGVYKLAQARYHRVLSR